MIFRRTRGPLVHDVTKGKVRIERGDASVLTRTGKVAIIAQYSATQVQPRSLSEYLRQLEANDYATLIVATCEAPEPLTFPHGIPEETVIMRRPNLGYDFGSWATALGTLPQLRRCPVVLLTNDSLLGPFAPIDHLLAWAGKPGPSIRGLTSSYQFVRHIQSYFLAFRQGILDEAPWRDFFNNVRIEPDKDRVVLSYELGTSRLCFAEAYSWDEWVTGPDLGVPYSNPTVDGWKNLIEADVPFLKRTIMTHPSTLSESAEAAVYIQRRFNEDITQW